MNDVKNLGPLNYQSPNQPGRDKPSGGEFGRAPIYAYVPVILALLQIPYLGIVELYLAMLASAQPSAISNAVAALIIMLPCEGGILFGLFVIVFLKPANPLDRFFAYFGSAVCLGMIIYLMLGGPI
jgi:hypothetical protein